MEASRDTISFEIKVLPLPVLNTNPDPVSVCDSEGGNGFATFGDSDLQAAVNQIANGEPVSVFVFTVFTQADTETPDFNLSIDLSDGFDFVNTIAVSQTLYARVERDMSPSDPPESSVCYTVIPFELRVEPLPQLIDTSTPYLYCEEFDGDDTQTQINLITFADQ